MGDCGIFAYCSSKPPTIMTKKMSVEIEFLEDISTCMQILFDIVKVKDLTDEEVDKMKYVNKLLVSANKFLQSSNPI